MSQRFTRGITECAEVLVALKRLEAFMHLDEKKPKAIDNGKRRQNGVTNVNKNAENHANFLAPNVLETEFQNNKVSISMQNVTASWSMPNYGESNCNSKENPQQKKIHKNDNEINTNNNVNHCGGTVQDGAHLQDLNIDFPKGMLIGVIGPVGAGKSSLLQAILRELPLESGSINVNGTISYASQEPWVFAASVRQNILFGEEYDRERYNAVVYTCALETDFEQLEHGDLTIVGDRGACLSGGQKARIK